MSYEKKVKNDWGVFEAESMAGKLMLDTRYTSSNSRGEAGWVIDLAVSDWQCSSNKSYDGIEVTLIKEDGGHNQTILEIGRNQLEALRQHLNEWHDANNKDKCESLDLMEGFNQLALRAAHEAKNNKVSELWVARRSELDKAHEEHSSRWYEIQGEINNEAYKSFAATREVVSSTECKLSYLLPKVYELMPDSLGDDCRYIYIMQADVINRVKIGISKDPVQRLRQVQTGCPELVRIIATAKVPHSGPVERALHEIFDEKRTAGEWFNLDSDDLVLLRDFVKKCGAYYKSQQGGN